MRPWGRTTRPAAHPLRSLRLLFWGLIAVVVDVRVDGPDLVPDPVGWLVALVAVARLARLAPGFGVAAVAAAGSACWSRSRTGRSPG